MWVGEARGEALGNMEMGGVDWKGGDGRGKEGKGMGDWMSPPMSEADRRRCRCVTAFY